MATDDIDHPEDSRVGTILVASYHAPPGRGVGGLRWWGLSRHLARRGWRVHLLTAQEGAASEPVPRSMSVEEVAPDTTLNDRYRTWKRNRIASRSSRSESSGMSSASTRILPRLRNELGGLLSFPDEGRGWIRPLACSMDRAGARLRPDLVISTGPPHSVHLGTCWGLRSLSARWIADFRDPWVSEARVHLDVSWSRLPLSRLESGVIQKAHHVLTTTPELSARMSRDHPAARISCLFNGVDIQELHPRAGSPERGLRVAHIGSLYLRRDPAPALRAFARFLERCPAARSDGSRVQFVGRMLDGYETEIRRLASKLQISDRVDVLGVRPREEALRILSHTGVSIVLAQEQKNAVPAKIYEAVGMGIPTLVITENDSASAAAARRLNASAHPSEDLDGMARALERAWTGEWTGHLPEGALIDYKDLAKDLDLRILRPTLAGESQ